MGVYIPISTIIAQLKNGAETLKNKLSSHIYLFIFMYLYESKYSKNMTSMWSYINVRNILISNQL